MGRGVRSAWSEIVATRVERGAGESGAGESGAGARRRRDAITPHEKCIRAKYRYERAAVQNVVDTGCELDASYL
jgi:hypothetical protein